MQRSSLLAPLPARSRSPHPRVVDRAPHPHLERDARAPLDTQGTRFAQNSLEGQSRLHQLGFISVLYRKLQVDTAHIPVHRLDAPRAGASEYLRVPGGSTSRRAEIPHPNRSTSRHDLQFIVGLTMSQKSKNPSTINQMISSSCSARSVCNLRNLSLHSSSAAASIPTSTCLLR